MSTFSGLGVAASALTAARRALDVTGQNIANATTEGYSRQRAELQSVGGSTVAAFYSRSDSVGQGVDADAVSRIRDALLEQRAYTEHATGAQLTVADATFSEIQAAFREPGSDGIQKLMSGVWGAWGDLSNNPTDDGTRTAVLQKTQALADGLAAGRASLDALWNRTRDSLVALTGSVNATVASIAGLNESIQKVTLSGQSPNALADKRDALVLQLAGQVGATAQPGENGMVTVFLGGAALVSGATAVGLEVAGPSSPDAVTATDVPRLVTRPGGVPVVAGGTAGGRLTALGGTVPGYRAALDQVAADLVSQVNAQHAQGYDATGAPGGPLLGPTSGTVTAANLTVLIKNPKLVAASAVAPSGGVPAIDAGNADAMGQLRTANGSVDGAYRSMVVALGVQAASTTRALDTQAVVTQQVDLDREATSGVDIDEEMTNMLSYQHMYAAAGRLVTAIDEMLDVVINRMGMVGR